MSRTPHCRWPLHDPYVSVCTELLISGLHSTYQAYCKQEKAPPRCPGAAALRSRGVELLLHRAAIRCMGTCR